MDFCGELGYSFDLSDDWTNDEVLRAKTGETCLNAFKNIANQASMLIFVDSLNNLDAFQLILGQKRDEISKNSQIFEENCDFGKKIAVIKARNDKDDKFIIYCFFEIAKNILGHIVIEVRELDDAGVLFAVLESWNTGGGE